MRGRHSNEDAFFANGAGPETVDHRYTNQAVLGEDCTGDSEKRSQRERRVGGVGEVRDGLGVEVIARGA